MAEAVALRVDRARRPVWRGVAGAVAVLLPLACAVRLAEARPPEDGFRVPASPWLPGLAACVDGRSEWDGYVAPGSHGVQHGGIVWESLSDRVGWHDTWHILLARLADGRGRVVAIDGYPDEGPRSMFAVPVPDWAWEALADCAADASIEIIRAETPETDR